MASGGRDKAGLFSPSNVEAEGKRDEVAVLPLDSVEAFDDLDESDVLYWSCVGVRVDL